DRNAAEFQRMATALNASNLGSGTVPVARLGSGTPSVSTFLRGDGSWQVVAGVGETNTASNLGTGAGVFKQKVGVDLELRTLLSGSGRLSVTAGVNEILMDVVEGSLTLANLAGSLSGSRISGGTFGAVNAANLTNINGGSITSGIVSASRLGSGAPGSGNFLRGDGTWQAIPASGEANTASNVGLGAGVFKQKTSADLEFRSLVPGSSKISVSQNTDDVTLDVDESSISLANLTGSLSGSKISGGTFGAVNSSNLTNLHASNLTTGTVATARLGSGLASGSTFLRGDGTWATPPSAGEVNTASNVGSGGEVYKQKVGADLEYRTLSSASSRLTITQNANELTF
ncbi:MAG TPA: hypothetical protein PKC28_15795, partial [Bdellovibrionales bacterium]|nr:hypothetical protein [Bdellovibrionales bacterium]